VSGAEGVGPAWQRPLSTGLFALGVVVAHAALKVGAEVLGRTFDRDAAFDPVLGLGGFLAWSTLSALCFAASTFVWRPGGRGRVAARVIAFSAYLVFAIATFGERPEHTVGHQELAPGYHVYRSNGFVGNDSAREPQVPISARGYRGKAFDDVPGRGVLRGIGLGDSFMFGACLATDETFPVQLENTLGPALDGLPVEVLNLGIQGTSLHSYVAAYGFGTRRFAPDFAVMSLGEPGDYETFDFQDHWSWIRTVNGYSLAGLVFGLEATWSVHMGVKRVSDVLPPGYDTWARGQADRLLELRRAAPGLPLVLLAWTGPMAPFSERLRDDPDVVLVQSILTKAEHRCSPTDAHPSPLGVSVAAARVQEALKGLPSFQARVTAKRSAAR